MVNSTVDRKNRQERAQPAAEDSRNRDVVQIEQQGDEEQEQAGLKRRRRVAASRNRGEQEHQQAAGA